MDSLERCEGVVRSEWWHVPRAHLPWQGVRVVTGTRAPQIRAKNYVALYKEHVAKLTSYLGKQPTSAQIAATIYSADEVPTVLFNLLLTGRYGCALAHFVRVY